jgi:hypothetical protein
MGSLSPFDPSAKCRAAALLLANRTIFKPKFVFYVYFAIHPASATVRVFHIPHRPRKPVEKSELEGLKKIKPGR